ncbi:MAG: UpxY family transcription antiterminator [Chitinophagaceae bacterium]|nr:MAG: UpxY family transcription antiterminator [Chitinophagaceae bacterium]
MVTKADAARWYPVYTHPRAEKKAYEALVHKGVEVYLPLHRQLRQWSDRKKWIEAPFIKSYIFVYIREHEQADVLMTKGIARFIYFSGSIAAIPDRQIEDLKLLLAVGADLEVSNLEIAPGEKVLIKAGPFKGILAELVSLKNNKKIVLRLQHLGYSITINTSISYIELLS